jgi:alpha-galactosidase
MHEGDIARLCSVKLSGVKQLELRVTDAGNGDSDHANWVDAKFEAVGVASFATYYPVPSEPYILTPKPSAKPKINSAIVFGVRPGSPFQFRIPATGDRPMTFLVTGLPQGLKLDQKTGLITGKLVKAGTYVVQLKAKNAKGIAQKSLRLSVVIKLHLPANGLE